MIGPCQFVIFGATGDLALNKLLPALYYLSRASRLPDNMEIVGVSRRELDNAQFDAMFAFAQADGRAKGFEAGMKHRRMSGNPFHKSYLHGAPAMYFRTGYRLGN